MGRPRKHQDIAHLPGSVYRRLSKQRENAATVARHSPTGYYRANRYGLTVEQLAELEAAAGGKCEGCGAEVPLVVDHCHATNDVRGMLCNDCNLVLGRAKDSPATLRALADYLEAKAKLPFTKSG
jgi:hypothetical protein